MSARAKGVFWPWPSLIEKLTSKKVIAALTGHPELEYSFHKLFEVLNEVLDEDIEDGELNDDSEVSSLNTDTSLPKLFAPFKNKARGWTVKSWAASSFIHQHFGLPKWWTKHIARFKGTQSIKAKLVSKFYCLWWTGCLHQPNKSKFREEWRRNIKYP